MKKSVKEKHGVSTESSKTSFSSSSCSSSFSSMDYNRTSQLESPAFSHTIFPEISTREFPIYQPNGSPQLSRKSLDDSPQLSQKSVDLRDVVKDSIHREARGILVRTAAKNEAGYQNLKYIDSPRPMQQPKSANTRPSNLNESCRYLPRLGDAGWSSNERKDGSLVAAKDTRRFSCDGRESRDGLKSTIKLKELPRLSLDSRECSLRCSTIDRKSNCLPGDLCREKGDDLNQQQEPGSYRRPSSVVAKLMGLEIIPDSPTHNHIQTGQTESRSDVICDPFSKSSRKTNDSKQNWTSSSPRQHSHEKPTSPRLRNADSVKKPIASSRCPIEPAPWRQQEGSKGQTPALKTASKVENSSLSVYGEIEKRLAQLEFKKSGKDLRALKQILEAMQKTKEVLESRKDCTSNLVSQTRSSLVQTSSNQISPAIKGAQAVKTFKSPIVIIKPAKCDGKATDLASAVSRSGLRRIQTGDSGDTRKMMTVKQMTKDLTPRSTTLRGASTQNVTMMDKNTTVKTFRLIDTSKETPPTTGDNTKSDKGSGNMNLRLQQKKIGSEKHSRYTIPSSESSRTRRQPNRQKTESGSPCRKYKGRSVNLQQIDNQLTESTNLREFSHQGDTSSVQSESNISIASTADTEITSADRSNGINVTLSEQGSQKQRVSILSFVAQIFHLISLVSNIFLFSLV